MTEDRRTAQLAYTGIDKRAPNEMLARQKHAGGRKPADPPVRPVMVHLDAETHERARELGRNNVSRGIREAIARAWRLYVRRALRTIPPPSPDPQEAPGRVLSDV